MPLTSFQDLIETFGRLMPTSNLALPSMPSSRTAARRRVVNQPNLHRPHTLGAPRAACVDWVTRLRNRGESVLAIRPRYRALIDRRPPENHVIADHSEPLVVLFAFVATDPPGRRGGRGD